MKTTETQEAQISFLKAAEVCFLLLMICYSNEIASLTLNWASMGLPSTTAETTPLVMEQQAVQHFLSVAGTTGVSKGLALEIGGNSEPSG